MAETLGKKLHLDTGAACMLQERLENIAEQAIMQALQQKLKLPLGAEACYRLVTQLSGLPVLLWAMAGCGPLDMVLTGAGAYDIGGREGGAYDRAQLMRQKWDEDPARFTADDFDDMRLLFGKALDGVAQTVFMDFMVDVGRNEPCPCGNGRKFKRCHGAAHGVDWYVGLTET